MKTNFCPIPTPIICNFSKWFGFFLPQIVSLLHGRCSLIWRAGMYIVVYAAINAWMSNEVGNNHHQMLGYVHINIFVLLFGQWIWRFMILTNNSLRSTYYKLQFVKERNYMKLFIYLSGLILLDPCFCNLISTD